MSPCSPLRFGGSLLFLMHAVDINALSSCHRNQQTLTPMSPSNQVTISTPTSPSLLVPFCYEYRRVVQSCDKDPSAQARVWTDIITRILPTCPIRPSMSSCSRAPLLIRKQSNDYSLRCRAQRQATSPPRRCGAN